MGTSERLEPHYAKLAHDREVIRAAKRGPLQSLSDRELRVGEQPVTLYPRPRKVQAWVRFGAEPVRVWARLLRSTPSAAGIEFKVEEQTYRCWVWGNAVFLDENVIA